MILWHVAIDTFGARSNSFLACTFISLTNRTLPNHKPVAFTLTIRNDIISIGKIISSATTSSVSSSSDSIVWTNRIVQWYANDAVCERRQWFAEEGQTNDKIASNSDFCLSPPLNTFFQTDFDILSKFIRRAFERFFEIASEEIFYWLCWNSVAVEEEMELELL